MLPDMEHVRDMQRELDALIQEGVVCLTNLLKNSENAVSNMDPNDDDDFQVHIYINCDRRYFRSVKFRTCDPSRHFCVVKFSRIF